MTDIKNRKVLRRAFLQATQGKKVGKNVGGTLYVHVSAENKLPAVLRQLIARARGILKTAIAMGTLQVPKSQQGLSYDDAETTLLKIDRDGRHVSFQKFRNFDADPHPALEKSVIVSFDGSPVKAHDFSARDNKPILHRKETFVAPDYPLYQEFADLTKAEEKAGLYKTNLSKIGMEKGWRKVLEDKGYKPEDFKYTRKTAPLAPRLKK